MPRRLLNGVEAIAASAIEGGVNFFVSSPDAPCVGVVQEAARQVGKPGFSELHSEVAFDAASAAASAMAAACDGAHVMWACSRSELYSAGVGIIAKRGLKMQGSLVIAVGADCEASFAESGSSASTTSMVLRTPELASARDGLKLSDIRRFAQFAKMPLFDPADPRQAMAMVRAASEMSAEYEMPVLLNMSASLASTSMFYETGSIPGQSTPARSKHDDAYLRNASLDEKIRKIAHAFSYDQALVGFNRIYDCTSSGNAPAHPISDVAAVVDPRVSGVTGVPYGEGSDAQGAVADGGDVVSLGIACAGSGVSFAAQALQVIVAAAAAGGVRIPSYRVLQVCMPYPYPKRAMYRFVNGLTDILVIEGPDSVIESGMLKDSANNFLAPKISRLQAASNVADIRSLAIGIANFFDGCAEPRQQSGPYNPGILTPLVERFFDDAPVYSCSVAMPPRRSTRFDDEALSLAFGGFVQAAAQLQIPPARISVTGVPHLASYGGTWNQACSMFRKAPLQVESAPLCDRLAWARQEARGDGIRAVVVATLREVLIEGLPVLMDLRFRQSEVTIIVADPPASRAPQGVDVASILLSLGVGVSCCPNPRDAELLRKACADALAMRGVSLALVVEGLTMQGGAMSSCGAHGIFGDASDGGSSFDGSASEPELRDGFSSNGSSAAFSVFAGPVSDDLAIVPVSRGASLSLQDERTLNADSRATLGAKQSDRPLDDEGKSNASDHLDESGRGDTAINGADSSALGTVTYSMIDEAGDDFSLSIQSIVQSFDAGSIALGDESGASPDAPYLTLDSLESGPEPPRHHSARGASGDSEDAPVASRGESERTKARKAKARRRSR